MVFTDEMFREYMDQMNATAAANLKLVQENAEAARLAAEIRHKEEVEAAAERNRLESLANEARYKETQDQLLSKLGEVMIANAGEEGGNGPQRMLGHEAKFDKVYDLFRKSTHVKMYNPKEKNVNAWI